MVVDDLRRLPDSPLVVAEGSTVSPELVGSGPADPSRAVWLLPTPEFQRAQLEERDLPPGPRRLYARVAEEIEGQAREHGGRVLPVDRTHGVDEMLAAVEHVISEAICGRASNRVALAAPRTAPRSERGRPRAGPRLLRAPVGGGRPRTRSSESFSASAATPAVLRP
jgi:hypothetical protein